ncbi:hypothetical protein N9199_01985 [bacterium]|nr:hypothetical protein [bacterium]
MGSLPGAKAVRERLAAAYVRPLWIWACPLLAPVPKETPYFLFRAILRSGCSWWCHGRWYAQRPQLHPHFSAALQAIKAVKSTQLVWSSFTHNATQKQLNFIGIKFLACEKDWGLQVRINDNDDGRIYKVTAAARRGTAKIFWTGSRTAPHALRAIARIRCLAKVHKSRNDAEGIDDVDIEASSHANWKDWVKQLTPEDKGMLDIYRSGASKTNTRMQNKAPCRLCGHLLPSMRHLWQECIGFTTVRQKHGSDHKLQPDFFTSQPRVTSKSGWITYAAAPSATMQLAACQLGLCIVRDSFTKNGHLD